MRHHIAAILLALAVAACGGAGDPSTVEPPTSAPATTPGPTAVSGTPQTPTGSPVPPFDGTVITISVADGKVTTERRQVPVKRGTNVRLVVTSDRADEVHVHGIDARQEVAAGATVVLDFRATVPGIVEVELERAKLTLVELRVS